MHLAQTFTIDRPPETVFDYVTDPANLSAWQTSKTRVEPLTDGPPRAGYRVREWTKPPGVGEFEQVVEFTEFDRPRRLHTHIVEGPYPIDGTWTFLPAAAGTRVEFRADGELRGLIRLAGPIFRRILDRQFAVYHENLRRNVESLG
jgi:uncharacterized protein YndB with AHSA1/START domain